MLHYYSMLGELETNTCASLLDGCRRASKKKGHSTVDETVHETVVFAPASKRRMRIPQNAGSIYPRSSLDRTYAHVILEPCHITTNPDSMGPADRSLSLASQPHMRTSKLARG
jgi:hypothetical protein